VSVTDSVGWKKLIKGHPLFSGKGKYPIAAYSEFMPAPRLGRSPYDGLYGSIFAENDLFGWYVSEVEEEHELQPGLSSLTNQIVEEIIKLGQGKPAYRISGHQGRNLEDNPYWPLDLASQAGKLPHERYVVFLPLALSRTQDDKGRVRWTFFGGSEQGPELAFWKSFYSNPGQERPAQEALAFISRLLSQVYREACHDSSSLRGIGFRILPTEMDSRFPYWSDKSLPSWTKPFLLDEGISIDDVRYLLTFRPFSLLPATIRKRYLTGQLVLLPFPGSLVFWGMKSFVRLQEELPMAMQLPLQRLAERHGGPHGIRIPQSGRFHESGSDLQPLEVQENLLLNTYKRTSRWDRVHRYENEVIVSTIEDTVGRVLFDTQLDVMGLYGKPMAKNSQLWTADSHLLLDGPRARRDGLEASALVVARGGTFRYRFQFPAMRVGLHEVYWQRPLSAYWNIEKGQVEMLANAPLGYFTAYLLDNLDLAHPIELWPRLQQRQPYLYALHNFEHIEEHYMHQTAQNILRVLDSRWLMGKPVPRSFARQILRLKEHEPIESWLAALHARASNPEEGQKLQQEVELCLEPALKPEPDRSLQGITPPAKQLNTITFGQTATRAFEEKWWNDIRILSTGNWVNKENADCVHDPATLARLSHRHRDLERLGDYLLSRHQHAIAAAEMEDKALCGEIPFHWNTNFDFSGFGGWKNNQEGHTHERDILVIIPGKNRSEAVVMADHYDTAYMEDLYDKSSGGVGARIAAAGADDNCSATATLLQAAPVFLRLSKDGLLERDIWLVHLTGEEFPSDCMGSRRFAQALVEKTLQMRLNNRQILDLSAVHVVGAYVMDMIGHNRDSEKDIFQISPGQGHMSLQLAWQAHLANELWNMETKRWNRRRGRHDRGRGKRSSDGKKIPQLAEFLPLDGEVRLIEDPQSTLFNTDGQILSDCGVPVVLFMENYDIHRSGYHDTKDTMTNIDLDYGAALAAIAIETVARIATLHHIL
jgi:Peptidase family M28